MPASFSASSSSSRYAPLVLVSGPEQDLEQDPARLDYPSKRLPGMTGGMGMTFWPLFCLEPAGRGRCRPRPSDLHARRAAPAAPRSPAGESPRPDRSSMRRRQVSPALQPEAAGRHLQPGVSVCGRVPGRLPPARSRGAVHRPAQGSEDGAAGRRDQAATAPSTSGGKPATSTPPASARRDATDGSSCHTSPIRPHRRQVLTE